METCGFNTPLEIDGPVSIADLSKSGSGLTSGSASNRDADVPRRAANTHVWEARVRLVNSNKDPLTDQSLRCRHAALFVDKSDPA